MPSRDDVEDFTRDVSFQASNSFHSLRWPRSALRRSATLALNWSVKFRRFAIFVSFKGSGYTLAHYPVF